MSLRGDFLKELQAIVGQTNQRVAVSDGPRTIRGAIDQCEPLAVGTSEFLLESSELAGIDVAKLEAASKSLCQRVNYLLEPISPIETDADGCSVQMRSKSTAGGRYGTILLRVAPASWRVNRILSLRETTQCPSTARRCNADPRSVGAVGRGFRYNR